MEGNTTTNTELTVAQAVARVYETKGDTISRQTINARIKAGTLDARMVGNIWLVDQNSLDNWTPRPSGRPRNS